MRTPPSAIRNWSRSAKVDVVAGVSAFASVITVPDTLGSVIVLSAVGSTTVRDVSKASLVAPSKVSVELAVVRRVSNVTELTSPRRELNSVSVLLEFSLKIVRLLILLPF